MQLVPLACLQAVPGLLETSPGVRSCMIEYDQRVLPLGQLLRLLEEVEGEMPSVRAPPAGLRVLGKPCCWPSYCACWRRSRARCPR